MGSNSGSHRRGMCTECRRKQHSQFECAGAVVCVDAQQPRWKSQSRDLVGRLTGIPLALKARNRLADVMQANHGGQPADDTRLWYAQGLCRATQENRGFAGENPFGHGRYIEHVREQAMANGIAALGPDAPSGFGKRIEMQHASVLQL